MTATESVSSNKKTTGAKNVSGVLLSLLDKRFIVMPISSMYADALNALIMGFFDMFELYQTYP